MNGPLQFSDSIYENIVFGNTLPSKISYLSQPHAFDPVQVIETAEFARLSFIRRHGLAWIVYPAATQTRLEYSIGNWGLARLAELLIQVETSNTRTEPLSLWLKDAKLRAEFYLSVLCEDLGSAPLAGALEVNEPFRAGLVAPHMPSAKNRTAALMAGYGLDTWHQIAKDRYGSANTLGSTLKGSALLQESVCIPLACFLLTDSQEYLSACSHTHKHHAGFVRDLIRGLLYLRKLDHYARDSYISTMRQFGSNLRGFLQNLILTPNAHGDGIGVTSINDGAADYAAGLLMKRRHRLSSKDHSTEVIALHEMANWALRAHCSSLGHDVLADLCKRIVFMEDDQILELLSGSHHKPCRIIAQRIRGADPYVLVGKWEKRDNINKVIEMVNDRNGETKQDREILPEVLVRYIEGNTAGETDNCFAIRNIRIGHESALLADHPRYKNNVAYLETLARQGCLYVFSKERQRTRLLRSEIDALLAH